MKQKTKNNLNNFNLAVVNSFCLNLSKYKKILLFCLFVLLFVSGCNSTTKEIDNDNNIDTEEKSDDNTETKDDEHTKEDNTETIDGEYTPTFKSFLEVAYYSPFYLSNKSYRSLMRKLKDDEENNGNNGNNEGVIDGNDENENNGNNLESEELVLFDEQLGLYIDNSGQIYDSDKNIYYPIEGDEFTFANYIYFSFVLEDDCQLTEFVGKGKIECSILDSSIFGERMIIFKNNDKYFSCFEIGAGVFSPSKRVVGFYFAKLYATEGKERIEVIDLEVENGNPQIHISSNAMPYVSYEIDKESIRKDNNTYQTTLNREEGIIVSRILEN